jgi:hypothetical protein
MEDDAPLDTFSLSHETKVKKIVLVGGGGGKYITEANLSRTLSSSLSISMHYKMYWRLTSWKQLEIGC